MINDVLSKFQGVKRSGNSWQARCPAHDDGTASLCIDVGDDGRILLCCQAKCSTEAVISRVGLTMHDLFPPRESQPRGHIVAQYDYRDEGSTLLYQACRKQPKGFIQRKPEGDGWSYKLNGVRRVLYRLPELIAAGTVAMVFVAEGEKDVDRLRGLGLVATCNAGGAGKWRPEYNEHLRGLHVVILPDNDKPGRDHAHHVAWSLQGIATSVKVLELPGLPAKGDVSDWLDAGGTVEQLQELVTATSEWVDDSPLLTIGNKNTPSSEQASLDIDRAEGQTEAALAERLIRAHGDEVIWVEQQKRFYVFDGKRWADDPGAVRQFLKDQAVALWPEFAEVAPRLEGTALTKAMNFVKSANSAPSIRNVELLVKCDGRIRVISPDAFNQHPHLFNVENGTLDLRSGELRQHQRQDRLTQIAPVKFDPAADCPLWCAFLNRIMAGNRDNVAFLRRLAGYCLWGAITDHVLVILFGCGANGKSVFLGTLRHVFGPDYATEAPPELLVMTGGEQHPTGRASLFGRRLVTTTEVARGRQLAEAQVKQLTGDSQITARRMREDFWTFTPSHTLVMAGNHKPRVQGSDKGIWRRLKLVPFTVSIPVEDQDPDLPEKLKAEASGILNWCLLGCQSWQDDGKKLIETQDVLEATAAYQAESDHVGRFLDDCTETAAGDRVAFKDLFDAYKQWAESWNRKPISASAFAEDLDSRGIEMKRGTGGTRFRLGLHLLVTPSDGSDGGSI
jgi:putative DNA primase/helicase